jgi:sugar phosphate isomerase/epimerase
MAKKPELIAAYFTLAGDVYPFGPTQVSPFPFRDRVEVASKAGWVGMGLIPDDVDATTSRISLADMKRMLDDNGIKYVELEFLVDWYLDGDRRKKSDELRQRLLKIAEALGVRNVKVAPGLGMDVNNPQPQELVPEVGRMRDAFVELCQDAAEHGTAITLEIMPFGNISRIDTGVAVVGGANQPNGGLLVDIWHLGRGGIDYETVSKIPAHFINCVELDDADGRIRGSLWEDTIFNRRLPGEGVLEPPAFIKAVEAAGYRGPWGVEILSATFRKLPLAEMATRAFRTSMQQFA